MRIHEGRALRALLLTAVALCGSGCGDDETTTPTPTYSVPGNWTATIVNTATGTTGARTIAFVGGVSSGTFYFCDEGCSIKGTYVASGPNVSFNFVMLGIHTYSGTAEFTNANTLRARYSCPSRPSDDATFTAVRQ